MNGFRSLLAATLLLAMSAPVALAQELEVELTIDPTGAVDPRTGLAVITGTLTCSEPAAFGSVSGDLIQPVGRKDSILGFFGASVECDVTPTPFEVIVVAFQGRFGPGTAIVRAFASACDVDFAFCGFDEVTTTVRLRAQKLDLLP